MIRDVPGFHLDGLLVVLQAHAARRAVAIQGGVVICPRGRGVGADVEAWRILRRGHNVNAWFGSYLG